MLLLLVVQHARFCVNHLLRQAEGCADIRPALSHSDAGGSEPLSFERLDERSAVLRCNDSMETWYVTCRDTRWLGDVTQINCSAFGVEPTRNGWLSFLIRTVYASSTDRTCLRHKLQVVHGVEFFRSIDRRTKYAKRDYLKLWT